MNPGKSGDVNPASTGAALRKGQGSDGSYSHYYRNMVDSDSDSENHAVASVSRASAVARSEGPTVHLAPRVHGPVLRPSATIAGTQQPLQRVPFTVGNLCQREEPLLTAETPDTISGCHWPEKMAPRQAESD